MVSKTEQQRRRSQRKRRRWPKWLRSPRVFMAILSAAITIWRIVRLVSMAVRWFLS